VHSSDRIGRRGRCSWAVFCAESRGIGGGVGGVLVWSENRRVQYCCRQNGAWRGRCGAPRCWVRVRCRAGLGVERRGCARVRVGMQRTLWAL
jgi:hypothetical protein